MRKIIIAVDGFSSCGKSTMAKDLAREIGYAYIDSGAMYRAVTLYCMQNHYFDGDKIDIKQLEESIDQIKITFIPNAETNNSETYLNGVNVERGIRTMEVANKVSLVSAIPVVRQALVANQQAMGAKKGIVMDGRDIGTAVFPTAELKIFVTASAQVRAERRVAELVAKGDPVSFDEVYENVKSRDHLDTTRTESPLRKADDALELDNSNLTIAEQKAWLLAQYNQVVSTLAL
jgi:cytidylate kinase